MLMSKWEFNFLVRGGWSSWTEWTKCSADCGLGAMFHSRNCTNPKPTSPELVCEGPSFEIRECTGTSCSQGVQGKLLHQMYKYVHLYVIIVNIIVGIIHILRIVQCILSKICILHGVTISLSINLY